MNTDSIAHTPDRRRWVPGVLLVALIACAPALATAQIARGIDSGSSTLPATEIEIHEAAFPEVVTAIRNGAGRLQLISWRLGETIRRTGDSGNQAGKVGEIALVRLGRLVTAVRTAEGDLKLISWRHTSGPTAATFERLGDSGDQAGRASQIAIALVPDPAAGSRLVTAVRTREGRLRLISWDLGGDGSFLRRGDSGDLAGEASRIALAAIGRDLLLTAVRTAEGELELIAWRISADGRSFTRLADSGSQAGKVSEIAMTSDGRVTAVRTAERRLKLIRWEIASDGSRIRRIGDSGNQAGRASLIALSSVGGDAYVTAVRTAEGILRLISWRAEDGGGIARTGDSGNQAGKVSAIAMTRPPVSNRFVTAVRDRAGRLKLIQWTVDR